MRLRSAHSQRGIALIMVLMIVAVLIAIAGGFALSMKVETTLARNASWDTELEWMGISGMEVAKWALAYPRRSREEHLGQAWAGGHTQGEENPEAEVSGGGLKVAVWPDQPPGLDYHVTIEDLDRKFNLNAPQVYQDRELMKAALDLIGLDASVIPTIIGSIQDWIDRDSDLSMNGTESDFYETLDPPYRAKNTAMDDISELLYVRGIRENPNAFWGSGAPTGRRYTKSARQSVFEAQLYDTGMRDIFSAFPLGQGNAGPGMLNINTASRSAMMAIPGMVDGIVAEIERARQGPDGDIVPLRPEVVIHDPRMARYFKSQSSTFEVKVTVRAGKANRTYIGRLGRRGGSGFELLDFAFQDQ